MKTEKFAEINNVGYDKAIKLATLSLDKIERLAKLNLDTAKTVLANGTQNAGAITAVKDVPSLLALNAKFAEAGMKDVIGYSRAVYAIASEAQTIFTRRFGLRPSSQRMRMQICTLLPWSRGSSIKARR